MNAAHRIILVLVLSLAIILPKVGSAVQMVLLGDLQVVVLCTGDGIVTIRLDAQGNPVETAEDANSAPCIMGDILQADARAVPLWQTLSRNHGQVAGLFRHTARTDPPYLRRRPARAPPILTV
ncbi:hypothetical protein [Aliiroseovarius halocynthiae]|uniref:DUF2946 domain-containing protein n=1 Tax=Aliiroseovarius halocynthiae TaxID=985055 RepID=A0A545STW7_9RHOB|nr:hypothetical protein [Aliiroseovarius halocynthiae]TQV68403.1 hypothetical protein FIL88_02085 [Aliiroseovarius halocynthiae]